MQFQFRQLSVRSTSTSRFNSEPDHSLVDERNAPAFWRGVVDQNSNQPAPASVYREMVSKEEADAIASEILGNRMKRKRYEKGHWDSVITGYKEVELYDIHQLLEENENGSSSNSNCDDGSTEAIAIMAKAFGRIRKHLEKRHLPLGAQADCSSATVKWLPCHAIDLRKKGELNAHVDSVRFSGHLVAGLSLLSPAIMRLRHPPQPDEHESEKHKNETSIRDIDKASSSSPDIGHVDLFLPPRSLYVLSGVGRYECSHEILPDASTFHSEREPIVVSRDQRLSIIFRDDK